MSLSATFGSQMASSSVEGGLHERALCSPSEAWLWRAWTRRESRISKKRNAPVDTARERSDDDEKKKRGRIERKGKGPRPNLAERAFADEVDDVVVLHCVKSETTTAQERERERSPPLSTRPEEKAFRFCSFSLRREGRRVFCEHGFFRQRLRLFFFFALFSKSHLSLFYSHLSTPSKSPSPFQQWLPPSLPALSCAPPW